jgi:hypothetical protein
MPFKQYFSSSLTTNTHSLESSTCVRHLNRETLEYTLCNADTATGKLRRQQTTSEGHTGTAPAPSLTGTPSRTASGIAILRSLGNTRGCSRGSGCSCPLESFWPDIGRCLRPLRGAPGAIHGTRRAHACRSSAAPARTDAEQAVGKAALLIACTKAAMEGLGADEAGAPEGGGIHCFRKVVIRVSVNGTCRRA